MLERGAVEPGLEPGHHRVRHRLVRPRPSGGRHRARPQLAHDLFPHLRVLAHMRQIQRVERQAADVGALVVAGDAVLLQHGAERRIGSRARGGRLRRPGAARLRRRASQLHVVGDGDDATQHADHRCQATGHYLSASSGIAAAHGAGHGISLAPSVRSSSAVRGWAANELPYSTPSATLNGVRPSLATTSSCAPGRTGTARRCWRRDTQPRASPFRRRR